MPDGVVQLSIALHESKVLSSSVLLSGVTWTEYGMPLLPTVSAGVKEAGVITIIAVPAIEESIVLVAVTVALVPGGELVKLPLASIEPLVADHMTDWVKLPVPAIFAEHSALPAYGMEAWVQVTVTEEIVVRVRAAVPVIEWFCWLVAVIVALSALAGAVKRPA